MQRCGKKIVTTLVDKMTESDAESGTRMRFGTLFLKTESLILFLNQRKGSNYQYRTDRVRSAFASARRYQLDLDIRSLVPSQ